MTDPRTMAYINLFAVLGTLPYLCETDAEARELANVKRVTIGISVKDGPCGKLTFENGGCEVTDGCDPCDIKLVFPSCEKFNAMIDGTYTPIPRKGFLKLGFLTKNFIKLTDILTKYLRCEKKDLENREFFEKSTTLMFHLILSAIAQIGNQDKVGKASASYITDGTVKMSAGDFITLSVDIKDHKLTAVHSAPEKFTSFMAFDSVETARALFDGEINAVACIGTGNVRVGGMISQVDNVNRILDRVALYLA
ncbi:MAG: hypothetical protein E7626_01165 [Ruminococcaceae bacterium]|nr:hypothetical protein [Oscillospiraceae bacterium]